MSQANKGFDDYLDKMKTLYTALSELFEAETGKDNKYSRLLYQFDNVQIKDNGMHLKSFLHLFSKFTKHHRRQPDFFKYVDLILNFFREDIPKHCSNSELYSIFKGNLHILLFLIKNKLLNVDYYVLRELKSDKTSTYFQPEIRAAITKSPAPSDLGDFDEKRLIGLNDTDLCEIIREGTLETFVSHTTGQEIDLNSRVEKSDFETNSFLISNEPTLIEYAAFYGSKEIVSFLIDEKVTISPLIWLFAVHSQNTEILKLLKKKKIKPEDRTYKKVYEEAVRCHHNDVASFIATDLMKHSSNQSILQPAAIFRHYNFSFIQKDMINKSVFLDLCFYDYACLIDFLYKAGDCDINGKRNCTKMIQIFIF